MGRFWVAAISALAAGVLAGCQSATNEVPPPASLMAPQISQAPKPAAAEAPLVLMIGLDGLNPSMIDRWEAPHLKALALRGVRAEAMYPVMPSVTFVNFYSLATGLYPKHHGIVENYPYDKVAKEQFGRATGPTEERWWQGEPIWVTAEKQGLPTSIMFWLGSEVPHDGVRPTRWTPYEHNKPYQDRVDEVLAWYDAPVAQIPRFAAVYFDRVDTAAHYFGPGSEKAKEALAEVDGYVGQLAQGLKDRGLLERTTIIVVSDHGMAWVDPGKVLDIGAFLDLTALTVPQFSGPYGGSNHPFLHIYGEGPALEKAYEGLKDFDPHIHVYRSGEMPAHYHFDHPTRGPDLFLVADPGWSVRNANIGGWRAPIPGQHGYDNLDPAMAATFIAAGPVFPEGETAPPFENVNVYLMIACALGIEAAETDGNPAVVQTVTGGRCLARP